MRIITISDTHGHKLKSNDMPEGDVLIHAGDITHDGHVKELVSYAEWFADLKGKYKHIIVIAGNHDWCFEFQNEESREVFKDVTYLQDEEVVIDGVKFYGSPWQPTFYDWAFNLDRGVPIREKWNLIPLDTDILITHGPAYGFRDLTMDNKHVGCEELRKVLGLVKPKIHVSGHIHASYGLEENDISEGHTVISVNTCTCNERYEPNNNPIIIDI